MCLHSKARVDLGVMKIKKYSVFPRDPALLELHHKIVSYLGHLLKNNPSAEMLSVYSTAPADRATGHSLAGSYLSVEMQSVYSTAPADGATGHALVGSYLSVEM